MTAFLIPLALPFIEQGIQSIFDFANSTPAQNIQNSDSEDDGDYYSEDDYAMDGY